MIIFGRQYFWPETKRSSSKFPGSQEISGRKRIDFQASLLLIAVLTDLKPVLGDETWQIA